MKTAVNTTHPKGVYAIFIMQLLAMVGFSMIFSLIVLYCTKILGFNDHSAYAITAAFNAMAFVMSLPAGWIAEKYIGFKNGTLLSVVISALGLMLMAIPSTAAVYAGLGVFIVGTGMSVPCIFILLGNLYHDEHPARENGFVVSYIGMNLGSFLASASAGYIANFMGYGWAFTVGAITTLAMLPILYKYNSIFTEENSFSSKQKLQGLALTVLLVIASIVLVSYSQVANVLMLALGFISLVYVLFAANKHKGDAKKGLIIFVLLTAISVIFWTLYALTPSLLTLFTERNVDRSLFGHLVPTADFSALNPFFIVTMGPLVALGLSALKKINIKISTAVKFGIGTVLMGLGYLVLAWGISFSSSAGLIAIVWIVVSYFFQTVGELFVGPIGYAMVGEFVPKAQIGVMMGIWQLSAGIAGSLSEYLANYAAPHMKAVSPVLTNPNYQHAFNLFGGITIAVGLLTLIAAPFLIKGKKVKSKAVQPSNDYALEAESIAS